MTDLASDQLLAEGAERYLLTLVFKSAICWSETAGGYHVRRRIIRMEVSNLRSSALTSRQMKSLAACLPSLQCGPRTDDRRFAQTWRKEMFDVHQFGTTSHPNAIPPTAGAERSEQRRRRPQGSRSLVVTPVHPQEIDIQALANTQNHFNVVEVEGMKSVRVTSLVQSPDGGESRGKWRVSDYDLDGQMILSVICSVTKDMIISRSERGPPGREESRMAV